MQKKYRVSDSFQDFRFHSMWYKYRLAPIKPWNPLGMATTDEKSSLR